MNRILVVILVVLGSLAAWYFGTRSTTTYKNNADLFAIKDTESIHKIFLADRNGTTVTLTRENDKWMYEGKYKVRKSSIETLLETVQKMEVLMLPAEAAEGNIKRDLATNGILARFYDKNGKKLMGYQIGGVSPDGQGTNIIMEGEKQPYIVHIPIWEGHLTPRYLIQEKDWRDRAVFSVEYDEVKSVSVEYPNQKSQSFKLELEDGEFKVAPFYNTTARINRPVKQGTVQRYLIGFKRLEAEAIINGREQEAGITQQLPFAILNLEKKDGTSKKVTFYPIAETFNPSLQPETGMVVSTEKYFATLDDDFLLVQQIVFGKLFWSYTSFFE